MVESIQVVFDKSHLTTIGEKLYGESLELIRELASNAYDADATAVRIELEPGGMRVRDNGIGMSRAGLQEYFNIGSQNKVISNSTPTYGRIKIGQFGIGKFAVLSACNRFRLHTQKDGYAAEVVFDKNDWKEKDAWSVPVREMKYDENLGNGTTVTLEKLKKNFTALEIERFIRERLPLSAPHFEIYLNDKKIEPVTVSGLRFPVSAHTEFGLIQGEIIAPNFRQKTPIHSAGIEVAVNGVVIKKETFDIESLPVFSLYKLMGRISANFLQITSDRGRFITDSAQYKAFCETMRKELKKITGALHEQARLKARQKADETLKDALSRLGRAIRKNPDFSPKTMSASGEIDPSENHPNSLASETTPEDQDSIEAFKTKLEAEGHVFAPDIEVPRGEFHKDSFVSKPKKVKIKNLAGKMLVARRIKIGGLGIVCTIESFGKNERPVFTESGVIYVNQDHSLYQKQARLGTDNLSFYLGYLLSQQIALLAAETDAYRAFEIQGKLLTDSF